MKILAVIILIIAVVAGVWLYVDNTTSQPSRSADATTNQLQTMTATIKTSKGDIQLDFFADSAPKTVENFKKLADEDFYQGVIFHRVIEDFMIQAGDPTGTGSGGPGYTFDDELDPDSAAAERGYTRGTLAMANRGPDTNGSQFFIMHQDQDLPFNYTIFGYVTDGMDVVDDIATVATDPNDKPLEEVIIKDIEVSS